MHLELNLNIKNVFLQNKASLYILKSKMRKRHPSMMIYALMNFS